MPRPWWMNSTSSASALRYSSACGWAGRQRPSVTSSLTNSGTRPGHRIAGGLQHAGLQMMMPQGRLPGRSPGELPGRLDLAHAGRRPQVVADAVRPAEAGGGDDFLVVDALAAIAGFARVLDVPLARDGAELAIGWHGPPPEGLFALRHETGGMTVDCRAALEPG